MSGFGYYKNVITKNYANFEGRARRSEFWYFALFNAIIALALNIVGGMIGALLIESMGPSAMFLGLAPLMIYALAVLVPGLAVAVRRLHDTGKSGFTILLAFIPLVGGIILIVFYATEGISGPNQYGPDPKTTQEEIIDSLV